MRDFNIYGLGGCGINVLNLFVQESKQSRFVNKIVGVDLSSANPVTDGVFEVERMEGTEGSGGNKATHAAKAADFVKQVLAKHQPAKLNILVYAAAGGSGAALGPYMVRAMISKGIPVLSMVIGDTTSIKEMENTVSTLRSLAAQANLLKAPVLFSYRENNNEFSQGAVNRTVVQTIDNALTMLNLANERIDYADVKNFFYFSNVTNADPILAQMSFKDESNLNTYDRIPVAALSLYNNIDEIKAPFADLLYRKAGIFGKESQGYGNALHAILDHGTTINAIEKMMEEQETKQATLAGRYQAKVDVAQGASDDGMFF